MPRKYTKIEMLSDEIFRLKEHGKTHREIGELYGLTFENLLKQDFTATQINQKWATDFTYLFLKGGDVRYNCTIIDLYDRSVVASWIVI